mgnify:CR=1 FL=1
MSPGMAVAYGLFILADKSKYLAMATGTINVQADNIFPIIKKFLYSDHEIFLRELVSNAVDATTKIKKLTSLGEAKGELGDLTIEVKVDKKKKTLTISDNGVGMTAEEIEKYINQIAFSGAEEFVKKYDEKSDKSGIIGHFGLGFYSAFMVADKVEIFSKSFKEEAGVHWSCTGSPEFELEESKKRKARGTDIVLHINEDSVEFLEDHKISELLNKYCRFLPVPIKFGTKEETIKEGEGEDAKEKKVTVDNIINNPTPAWTKAPSSLEEKDYKDFYRELYPMNFEEPLFHIHLNVDFPFELTGVLFFPKIKGNMDLNRDRIQLYCNQVFVTDQLEGIVPDFLNFLKGVIDSPDIPLNVSRSYLQSDSNVKKISSHITKKVADKLEEMFKTDRADFESKWEDIKVVIEYGMVSDEKFYEKAKNFYLYPDVDGTYLTWDELKAKTEAEQTNKEGNLVILYTHDKEAHHAYIAAAEKRSYRTVILDSPIVGHLISKLEQNLEKVQFSRIDADPLDKLIQKDAEISSLLSDEEKEALKPVIENAVNKEQFDVEIQEMATDDLPFVITQNEFMRRMKEMNETGGGMMGMGNLPDRFNLVVNANHPLVSEILKEEDQAKKESLTKQGVDLAMLSKGLLKGEALTQFVDRSFSLLKTKEN